jgi:glycerol-1-phosphate dehydrogenase [NAD(P)+]
MDLSGLLGTMFECECGRTHDVPVRRFVYEPEAVNRLPEIVEACLRPGSVRRAAVVVDVRTREVCGRQVEAVLKSAGLDVRPIVLPDRDHGGPVCDEPTFEALSKWIQEAAPDWVVAVGSGVINDLSKWTSFAAGLPYLVVATAASMNGYSAANVAPTVAGVKVLVKARPPLAVVAEPEIIERAPCEMTAAGFGDTIAKHQSNADWLMNHVLFDEYHCPFCAGIINEIEPMYLDYPEGIAQGRTEAVGALFEALFWTGLAMTLVGTSAPASGGEHLLSHTLDMVASMRGHEHDLHGRQVGVGTLLSAALYERVLSIDEPVLHSWPGSVDSAFWSAPSVRAAVSDPFRAKSDRLDAVRRVIGDAGA